MKGKATTFSWVKVVYAALGNKCCLFVSKVEEYQGMLENSGLVGYAQEVLKETDQSCFVQTAKQLHVR